MNSKIMLATVATMLFAGATSFAGDEVFNGDTAATAAKVDETTGNVTIVLNGEAAKALFEQLDKSGLGLIKNKKKADRPVLKSGNITCVKNGVLLFDSGKDDGLDTQFKQDNYACSMVINSQGVALPQIGLIPSDDAKFSKRQ